MKIIPRDVLRKIVKFARKGGQIYVLDSWPIGSTDFGLHDKKIDKLVAELQASPHVVFCDSSLVPELQKRPDKLRAHFDFIKGAFDILQQHRRIENVDYFWLANNSDTSRDCFVRFARDSSFLGFNKWSCESGDISLADNYFRKDSVYVNLTFLPYEAFWLVQNNRTWHMDVVFDHNDHAYPYDDDFGFDLIDIDPPISWTARIDTSLQPPIQQSIDIPSTFLNGQNVQLEDWSDWGLAQFSGVISYTGTFELEEECDKMFLDLGEVNAGVSVWINDQYVGDRLWPPYSMNCESVTCVGTNTIRVDVSNLRNNSLGDLRPSGMRGPIKITCYIKNRSSFSY
jgi:hypothetical protein